MEKYNIIWKLLSLKETDLVSEQHCNYWPSMHRSTLLSKNISCYFLFWFAYIKIESGHAVICFRSVGRMQMQHLPFGHNLLLVKSIHWQWLKQEKDQFAIPSTVYYCFHKQIMEDMWRFYFHCLDFFPLKCIRIKLVSCISTYLWCNKYSLL